MEMMIKDLIELFRKSLIKIRFTCVRNRIIKIVDSGIKTILKKSVYSSKR